MVSVRELKAKLSEFVERAAAGERIVVTSRGKAKAELRPLSAESRIEQGIREGWIKPGRGRLDRKPLGLKGRMTIAEAMAEDRADEPD